MENEIKFLTFQVTSIQFSSDYVNPGEPTRKFEAKVALTHYTRTNEADKNLFMAELTTVINTTDDLVKLTVTSKSIFRSNQEVTKDFLVGEYALEDAPAIAYPYHRSFVSTLTASSGFASITLPLVNFAGASERAKKAKGDTPDSEIVKY